MKTNNTDSTTPPVSILVYRNALKSLAGNGLPKVNRFRRKIFRTWKRVRVEPATAGTKDSIFFAPDKPITTDNRATPAEFVTINPDECDDLVHQGDSFEISFVGMNVSRQDCLPTNDNELLLYSLTKDPPEKKEAALILGRGASPLPVGSPPAIKAMKRKSMQSSYYTGPTGFSPASTDSPFIHYDPVVDAHDVGDEPDSFVPIPASKALYLQSNGHEYFKEPDKCVSIRFSLMELDEVSDAQVRAIAGLGDMGDVLGEGAIAMPYLELLSGAFEVASLLGKKGLQKYSRPDHVLSKDVEFKLAPAVHSAASDSSGEDTEADPRGCYLRYGYYFFLDKTVDAKLYAQTGSSTQHVPLLLKRENFDPKKAPKNEKEYFPLTGLSYVVVKVSRGVRHSCPVDRTKLRREHKRRLDSMLQMSTMMEMFANFEVKDNSPWGSWGGNRQRRTLGGKKRK